MRSCLLPGLHFQARGISAWKAASQSKCRRDKKFGGKVGKKKQLTTDTLHLSPHAAGVTDGRKKKVTSALTQVQAQFLMWHVATTLMLLDRAWPSCSQLLCLAWQDSTLKSRHARHTDRPLHRTKTAMVCKQKKKNTHIAFFCRYINMTDCRVCLRTTKGVEPSQAWIGEATLLYLHVLEATIRITASMT